MSKQFLSRALVLLAALVAWQPLAAQGAGKVLFDATHLQMAGNADWVIDEDSCGNPQRFPTPPQSGITASTPETYWTGGYSAFGVDLAKGGFQLETLPIGTPITYGSSSNVQDLSNYNVFIIPEPNVRLTASEKSAIVAFVQHGGGLFMISDHSGSDRNSDGWDSPMIFNDLGADTLFGIHFGVAADASNNIVDHPDANYTADPSSVIVRTGPFGACAAGKGLGIFNGTTMTLNTTVNPSAKGHIWATAGTADTSTLVTFATATYGSGRVAAIGDSSPSEDPTNSCGHTTYSGWGETTYDNAKIHLNAIAWLAAGGASCTDTTAPTATVTAPSATTLSGTVTVSATGSDNVGVTGMTLKIDGTTVATATTSAISYTWNTTTATNATHTITATATDACGNTGTSPAKSVTVNNTVATFTVSGNAGTTTATVSTTGVSATSDASSNYTLSGLAAGTYTITPSKSGCTFSPSALSVTVGPNATGKNFTASCGVVSTFPESAHPYTNSYDNTWTYTLAGAPASINVTFDPQTQVETNYDKIYVMDKNGVNITGSPFTSTTLAGATKNVAGDTVKIRLTSDTSVVFYGFKVTNVVAGGGTVDTTAPTTSVTAPANGATVTGTTNITATASDTVGVVKIEVYVDGALKGSNTGATSFTYAWATTGVANGTHTITSKAYDAANNIGTSATVTVTVNNIVTGQQLLGNPGFETGVATHWVASSGIVDSGTGEAVHSGSWKVWMNGYAAVHTDTLMQQITIPAASTSATLTFWLHIDTAETGTTAYDTLNVQVRNSSGAVLATLATYSNANAAAGFTQKSFNLIAYKGQTIQVNLVGVEDASLQTSFVVDDFALNVQ